MAFTRTTSKIGRAVPDAQSGTAELRAAEGSARFRLRPAGPAKRHNPHVDAGWWPRSANLAAELTPLLLAAESAGFHASQVTYRLDDAWTAPPRLVFAADRHVKVSGYHNHRRDMLTLVDEAGHQRLEIVVIPFGSSPAVAQRALDIVAYDSDPTLGEDIIARARDGAPDMTPVAGLMPGSDQKDRIL